MLFGFLVRFIRVGPSATNNEAEGSITPADDRL